ncbi:MAG: hypothetical protein GY801_41270 [bacterium]|nr:hypothetical protein [bacterium]
MTWKRGHDGLEGLCGNVPLDGNSLGSYPTVRAFSKHLTQDVINHRG